MTGRRRANFFRFLVGAAIAALLCALPLAAEAKKKTTAGGKKIRHAQRGPHRSSSHLAMINLPPSDETVQSGYEQRPEVQAFIAQMVDRNHFVRSELEQLFSQVRYSETVARLMAPPAPGMPPPKNWQAYRSRFVNPARIDAGAEFWRNNAQMLARAAQEFGVPEEIIVGIIGVETIYGRNTGNFRVVDALTTLAFDYPNGGKDRSPFFREQLEQFLLFTRDGGLDLLALKGSYAGAIGIPQFMPGSYRRYAIDYDQDGAIDLRNSTADAIGSVANFLVQHGWQRGVDVVYPVVSVERADPELLGRMVEAGSEPRYTPAEMRHSGISFVGDIPENQLLALIDLPNETRGETGSETGNGTPMPTQYVLGTQNFNVVTLYNRSYFYAMSVIELGTAVRLRMASR